MLNYGWESQIGSIEKGKFADIIAVSGNRSRTLPKWNG